jgi:hypothetical protein
MLKVYLVTIKIIEIKLSFATLNSTRVHNVYKICRL